jgi:hypothetical protein
MPDDALQILSAALPLAAGADAAALAYALGRLAELTLARGRAKFAELLAGLAPEKREQV